MFSAVVILAAICNSQQQTKDVKDFYFLFPLVIFLTFFLSHFNFHLFHILKNFKFFNSAPMLCKKIIKTIQVEILKHL